MPYLRNGSEVELVAEIGDIRIVAPFRLNGEVDYSSVCKVVIDDLFDEPPKYIYDLEISNLSKKLDELSETYRKLVLSYSELQDRHSKLRTNLARLIINKEDFLEAKTIHYFTKDELHPRTLEADEYNINKNKIVFSIALRDMKIEAWHYELLSDSRYSSSMVIDEGFGFMFNCSEEQLIKAAHSRQYDRTMFSDYHIKSTEDKWLNEEFLGIKQQIVQEERQRTAQDLQLKISSYQTQLNSLQE
jgi:hypothetical protein